MRRGSEFDPWFKPDVFSISIILIGFIKNFKAALQTVNDHLLTLPQISTISDVLFGGGQIRQKLSDLSKVTE